MSWWNFWGNDDDDEEDDILSCVVCGNFSSVDSMYDTSKGDVCKHCYDDLEND